MKVGIITFSSAHNYGAVLQAYATQTYLQKNGIEAKVINYRPASIEDVYNIYEVKKGKGIVKKLRKIKRKIDLKGKLRWRVVKYNNFENFIKNSLNTTKPYSKLGSLQKDLLGYDAFIAGSDQIWNTDLTLGFDPAYFLEFGKKDAIRIAYAPSLGRDDINPKFENVYKRYLDNFDHLSIREPNMGPVIERLTGKTAETVIDPTLLIDREDWENFKGENPFDGKEYIYAHYIGMDPKVTEIADYLSLKLGIPVVHNRNEGLFENELASHFSGTPEEFVGVIKGAKYIVSNSFHATCFSAIFEKDFITVPHAKRPERMQNLLELMGLGNHLVEDVRIMPPLDTLSIDYEDVKKRIVPLKESSKSFLDNALNIRRGRTKDNWFYTGNKFNCCGCELCKDICPVGAITMVEDEEGFKYPSIDENKCIHCDKCKKQCIYYNPLYKKTPKNLQKVYALVNKSSEVLSASASGGVFTAFYKNTLKKGGAVIGVKYGEDMRPVYAVAQTEAECEAFRGSKYAAADIGDIKVKTKELLEAKKHVLFTGNPCQIASLNKYLGKTYDNLLTLCILCHSVPSAKLFKKYVTHLEKKYGSKVINYVFRDKSQGWNTSTTKVVFEDGREVFETTRFNDFYRIAYSARVINRPSCYNCQFAGDQSIADLTMGDFWGIQKAHPDFYKKHKQEGISFLKIDSEKGIAAFEEVKDDFSFIESSSGKVFAGNHSYSIVYTAERDQIMKQVTSVPIEKLLRDNNRLKSPKTAAGRERINKSI